MKNTRVFVQPPGQRPISNREYLVCIISLNKKKKEEKEKKGKTSNLYPAASALPRAQTHVQSHILGTNSTTWQPTRRNTIAEFDTARC